MPKPLRTTRYCKVWNEAEVQRVVGEDVHAYRIQDIYVKKNERREVRFVYYKNGKFARCPLDLPEDIFLELMQKAFVQGVFTTEFREALRKEL